MPHQLVFTSSIRGIRPGSSGYCTVMQSPDIRPGLVTALEKLCVFEHNRANKGKTIYQFQSCEVRGTRFRVVSKISDAGLDYTGRTNFIAHHVAFGSDEAPAFSPADFLLHWPGWIEEWSGEPRTEAIELPDIPRILPPVDIWKQLEKTRHAAALASLLDTRTKVLLHFPDLENIHLLHMIAEAMSVSTIASKKNSHSWEKSFSVGVAVPDHPTNFDWLALTDVNTSSRTQNRIVFDGGDTSTDLPEPSKKLVHIAQTGKPHTSQPTTSGQGVPPKSPVGGPKTGSGPSTPDSGPTSIRTGSQKKKPSALPLIAMAAFLLLIVGSLAVYFTGEKKPGTNASNQYRIKLNNLHEEAENPALSNKRAKELIRELMTKDTSENNTDIYTYTLNEELLLSDTDADGYDVEIRRKSLKSIQARFNTSASTYSSNPEEEKAEKQEPEEAVEPVAKNETKQTDVDAKTVIGPDEPVDEPESKLESETAEESKSKSESVEEPAVVEKPQAPPFPELIVIALPNSERIRIDDESVWEIFEGPRKEVALKLDPKSKYELSLIDGKINNSRVGGDTLLNYEIDDKEIRTSSEEEDFHLFIEKDGKSFSVIVLPESPANQREPFVLDSRAAPREFPSLKGAEMWIKEKIRFNRVENPQYVLSRPRGKTVVFGQGFVQFGDEKIKMHLLGPNAPIPPKNSNPEDHEDYKAFANELGLDDDTDWSRDNVKEKIGERLKEKVKNISLDGNDEVEAPRKITNRFENFKHKIDEIEKYRFKGDLDDAHDNYNSLIYSIDKKIEEYGDKPTENEKEIKIIINQLKNNLNNFFTIGNKNLYASKEDSESAKYDLLKYISKMVSYQKYKLKKEEYDNHQDERTDYNESTVKPISVTVKSKEYGRFLKLKFDE